MPTEKLGYVNIYTVNIYFGIVSPTFSKAEQKKGKKKRKKQFMKQIWLSELCLEELESC